MKKLILASAVALLSAGAAQAGANVYASALKSADGKVQFVLNDAATSVVFNLIKDGEIIESVELGEGVKGLNTIEVPALDSDPGTYEWSLTVSAPAVTEVTQLTDGTQENIQIGCGKGVAVDNNPTSPYFGNVYVSAPGSASYKGARTGIGVFAFNAALETINEEPYQGGITWKTSASSPNSITVDKSGDLFICDWSDSNPGVWIMNPGAPETFAPVFADGTMASSGLVSIDGVNVHGSIQACAVYGTGANRILYTTDEDLNSNNGEIFVYNIGELATPWDMAPSAAWGNCEKKMANANQRLASDERGGLWVSQKRWNETSANPCLMHCNSEGVWDFTTGDMSIFVGSQPFAAMGVNSDASLIAIGGSDSNKGFTVARVSYDDAGVPSLTSFCKLANCGNYGARPFNVAFDAADNLYIQFNDNGTAGGLGVWALPKEKNEFTTPALEAVEVGGSGIQTGLQADKIGVSAIAYAGNTLSAAGAELEVYNIAGVKVAEGTAVDTTTLPAGIYVVRSGANTLKIRK